MVIWEVVIWEEFIVWEVLVIGVLFNGSFCESLIRVVLGVFNLFYFFWGLGILGNMEMLRGVEGFG